MNDWSIVVAGDATASERYAAEEFQSLFRQLTVWRCRLPARFPPTENIFYRWARPPLTIALMQTAWARNRCASAFSAKTRGSGGLPRGTLYGVYEFFERYCGVRF